MKTRPGSVMDLVFVKSFSKNGDKVPTTRIRPTENFRCRLSIPVHTYQAVPERCLRYAFDLDASSRGLFQNVINRPDDLPESNLGIDLRTAVVGRSQRTLVLHHRAAYEIAFEIVQPGAHAGRADVQTEYEFLSQMSGVEGRILATSCQLNFTTSGRRSF